MNNEQNKPAQAGQVERRVMRLPRYGIKWNGTNKPLATEMTDGYWTPWHMAARESDELAALVRRLAHSLRKASPDNELADKALDYLKRNGLTGSILRDA